MRTNDSLVLKIVHLIKSEISIREKETSRAKITDFPSHARLQGSLDGLDEALKLIEKALEGEDDD